MLMSDGAMAPTVAVMFHNGIQRGKAGPEASPSEPAMLLAPGLVAPHLATWASIALAHVVVPRGRAGAVAERRDRAVP
jgi:hypothetical protein